LKPPSTACSSCTSALRYHVRCQRVLSNTQSPARRTLCHSGVGISCCQQQFALRSATDPSTPAGAFRWGRVNDAIQAPGFGVTSVSVQGRQDQQVDRSGKGHRGGPWFLGPHLSPIRITSGAWAQGVSAPPRRSRVSQWRPRAAGTMQFLMLVDKFDRVLSMVMIWPLEFLFAVGRSSTPAKVDLPVTVRRTKDHQAGLGHRQLLCRNTPAGADLFPCFGIFPLSIRRSTIAHQLRSVEGTDAEAAAYREH